LIRGSRRTPEVDCRLPGWHNYWKRGLEGDSSLTTTPALRARERKNKTEEKKDFS